MTFTTAADTIVLRYIVKRNRKEYAIRKPANSGSLTEAVYYILLRLHRPAHGYALMKDIATMTDGRVRLGAGTLYGALDSLQQKDWIEPLSDRSEGRKKEYTITTAGKQVFEQEVIRLNELLTNAKNYEGK